MDTGRPVQPGNRPSTTKAIIEFGGGIGPSPEGVNRVTFYVDVDDLQAYLDKAEKLGGKTIMPPTVIPDMITLAMFSDPEGNIIGMVKEDSHSSPS